MTQYVEISNRGGSLDLRVLVDDCQAIFYFWRVEVSAG